MADKNRTQQKAPHGRAKSCMTGKRALAFTLSVLLAWMLAMPSVTSATTDDGTGVEEVAAATAQEETSASSKAAGTDSSAVAATTDTSAKDSSAAASSSASESSTDSKASSSDTAQNSATTSENVSGGGTSEAGSDDASASEESSSVAEESAAAKAAPALAEADGTTAISDLSKLSQSGSYKLENDVTWNSDAIYISNGVDTTLDLNGHTINYTYNTSLFHVQSGGTLTIKDSQTTTDSKTAVSGDVYGNEASVSYSNGKPTQLTYYVTESTPSTDASTTETLYQHTVTPRGVITATNGSGANSVIYMDGGTLNVQGGTICMPNSANHGSDCHIINVTGSSTFNLSGGYIAGGQRTTNYGGGVCLTNSSVLNMSGGVICANKGQSGAGVYAAQGTTVNVSNDAVISGNTVVSGSYGYSEKESAGYGGGIYAVGATVNVSGGYITNNRMEATSSVTHVGNLGGGGIAVVSTNSGAKNGSFSMSGGYVTGNYSNEAGGGIYAGHYGNGLDSNCTFTGGTIASNVAQNSEGGGIRVSGNTYATFYVSSGHAYVTNNKCNSVNDWGGGGVFVQADGKFTVKNALVTNNTAGGYGGGVAACPTGQTVITHTNGAAIYSNKDDVDGDSPHFATDNKYGKVQDHTIAAQDSTFTSHGHADYFLVRDYGTNPVTVVTGRMLGGGAAGWSGSVDGTAVNIDPNSGAEGDYLVGLTADPDNAAISHAVKAAKVTFSGNYAYNHGGGIMTNGGLILGEVINIDIYPGLKLNAKKSLMQDDVDASNQLKKDAYTFVLLSPTSKDSDAPSWTKDDKQNDKLNYGGCTESARTKNDKNGNIQFNVNSEYSQAGVYRYYVAELPNSSDTKTQSYDKTIYEITASVTEDTSQRTTLLGITFKHYTISNLKVTPIKDDKAGTDYSPTTTTSNSVVSFTLTKDGNSSNAAFTNTLKPYSTSGSFTPTVKKHVEGGEVKEFQFELYDHAPSSDGTFSGTPLQTKTTTKSDSSDATVTFDAINYTNLGENKNFTAGKGGTETYTYYIREKPGKESGYTYDTGYIKVVVTATDVPAADNFSGTLDVVYTYYDENGNQLKDKDKAKFDNKYAQTLPNAGQAGIALAYAAGGAALAYGLWRLVRSRRNARKGGDER